MTEGTRSAPARGAKYLSVTEAARRLKVVYLRARNLALSGKLGETTMEGRHLRVPEAGVAAYLAARAAKALKARAS